MMSKRVAILSDVVMLYGGAEKVLEALLELFPEAVLYSLFVVPGARKKLTEKFPKVKIRTSVWQSLVSNDKVSKYISLIKIFSWIYWEKLDLSKYDIIISSSHSFMSKNVIARKNAFHLSYIHTPPRYLYNEFNEIEVIRKFPWSIIFQPIKILLRYIDRRGAKRPHVLLANSKNVQARIKKYYGLGSTVVYPPVDDVVLKKYVGRKKKDYYVWVSRLVRQKGVYLAAETCEKLGKKLIVVGGGDEFLPLLQKKYKWVTFTGACNDDKKYSLMSEAKALLYTSVDEDFGIVPVEALKMGIPVIARNSGGVREVVRDGVNGMFFGEGEADLKRAILKFEKTKFSKEACQKSVKCFGKEIFQKEISELIKNHD